MKKIALVSFVIFLFTLTEAQVFTTSLVMTVRDETGNIVEGATVALYENINDYHAEKNPAAEGITDEDGVVKFKNLKAIAYFVLARSEDKDNAGGGEKTGKLEAKKLNKTTVVIQ